MADPVTQENLLETYIKENKKELAVELLFDLITQNAKAREFSKAEALRERIFEVDSMALTAIVESAEVIETEKMAAVDPIHLDIWSHLYEELTKEETLALYYEMEVAAFEVEQIIFQQGELNSNLYFIETGRLNMVYRKGEHGILLKSLGPTGQIKFFGKISVAKMASRCAQPEQQTPRLLSKIGTAQRSATKKATRAQSA